MNPRERVINSINFREVDRIPFHVQFTSAMRQKMKEFTGLDDYAASIDNHIADAYLDAPQVMLRTDFYQDEFGVIWNRSGVDKDIGVVDDYLIKEPEDLDKLVFPPVDEKRIRTIMEDLIRRKGDKFCLAGMGFSLFERAWTLCGMENLMIFMMEEPEFVHALMRRITDRNLEMIEIALEYDIDCFHFGDDWGQQKGLIMGPKCWHTFIGPYVGEMYAKVRKAGKYVSQHSCGDIREIMDSLYDMGLNIYQTFQPEIYTYDYAKKLKNRIAIWGGVSTQADLPRKTPDEIRKIVYQMVESFGRTGLIAAPTHAIPGDVSPENVIAMIEAFQNA